MGSRQFGREVAVTIGRPVAGEFFAVEGDITTITTMRVAFEVEKNLGSEPNTCTVSLFNLAPDTVASFQSKPLRVLLEAGYDGERHRVFAGDLRRATTRGDGVDAETILELGDGERAFTHARVNRSYREGVRSSDVLRELARTMGLEIPRNVQGLNALRHEFASGVSLNDRASTELTRLLNRHNLSWSIQDGRLQILGKNETRTEQAWVVSKDNGMIGSPELGAPDKPGKQPILTVKMLLRPEITPGGRIEVTSRYINGVFRVERLIHAGDSRGQDWMTTVEGKAI